MPYEVDFVENGNYVSGTLEGEITEAELKAARVEMNALLTDRNCERLLVDTTATSRMLSFLTDFEFTADHRSELPPRTWHAVVIRPDQKEHMQFVENVAQNRAVNLRLFTDRNEAIGWLLEDSRVQ